MRGTIGVFFLAAIVAATSQATTSRDATEAASVALQAAAIAQMLNAPERSEADRKRDAQRKPDEVLAFMGLGPGMVVLDLYSGGGYYSEIIARSVGDRGRVVAHNNEAYLAYARDEISSRYADGRLANVERLTAENNELKLPQSTFDMVTIILAYHDVYFVDEENGWPRIDGAALLAELHAALKPGGVLAIVDHVAEAGAPAETGGTLHRIDPARLEKDITAAGFVLEARGDMLRNPDDDLSKPMYDPQVRGKTDRVVFRFRRR